MECGMKIIKYLLFAFNLIFFVLALAMIGVGAAVEIKYRDVVKLSENTISAAPILLICIGVFILMISFFGCCGAYKENYCMVTTFAVLLVIIFILEIASGITAFALKGRIEQTIKISVQKAIKDYSKAMEIPFKTVQEKFHCCGGVSEIDWKNSTRFQEKAQSIISSKNITNPAATLVPDSCCVKVTEDCGLTVGHVIYNGTANGCVTKIEDFIKKNAGVIGGVGLGIAFMQIIGIIFACCLMRTIKKQYEVV